MGYYCEGIKLVLCTQYLAVMLIAYGCTSASYSNKKSIGRNLQIIILYRIYTLIQCVLYLRF